MGHVDRHVPVATLALLDRHAPVATLALLGVRHVGIEATSAHVLDDFVELILAESTLLRLSALLSFHHSSLGSRVSQRAILRDTL